MRFIKPLVGAVVLSFSYYGCTDSKASDETQEGSGEEEIEDYNKPGGGKRGKITPQLITPGEKTSLVEGCQQFVYKGKLSDIKKRIERSPTCYTPVGHVGDDPIEVTVYYQRHGESTWNVDHLKYGFRDHKKNTDAHLTSKGVSQALDAHKALQRQQIAGDTKDKEILTKGSYKDHRIVFATSNLRRAAFTFLITFKHLLKTMKKLHIVSALQELADNTDSDPLAGPREIPKLTFSKSSDPTRDPSHPDCPFQEKQMKKLMDATCNDGNERNFPDRPHINWYNLLEKQKTATTVDHINHFCTWMYNVAGYGETFADELNPAVSKKQTSFVVTGHSMYLRTFFDNFFDSKLGKKNRLEGQLNSSFLRMKNGTIIRFKVRLTHDSTTRKVKCLIVPSSTDKLFGEISWRLR